MTKFNRAALPVLLLAGSALLPGCLSSSQVQCVSGTVRWCVIAIKKKAPM